MRTGKYRVRRNWLGKCILQEMHDYPSYIGGQVDSGTRDYLWRDVEFDDLPNIAFTRKEITN